MAKFTEPTFFGDQWADVYDDHHAWLDSTPVVDFLVSLVHGGKALELAAGTGRVAIPLAARGVEVHALEASEAMVARMNKKKGGERIPVQIGDMACMSIGRSFDLIYLVFNGLFFLLTKEQQVQCFR